MPPAYITATNPNSRTPTIYRLVMEPIGKPSGEYRFGSFQINKTIAHFDVPTTRDLSLVVSEGDDALPPPWHTEGSRLQFRLLFVFPHPLPPHTVVECWVYCVSRETHQRSCCRLPNPLPAMGRAATWRGHHRHCRR